MADGSGKSLKSAPQGQEIYRVGTLEYTKRALVMVIFWLLWGDFCFTLMESVFPSVTPLLLRDLHAPNTVIGLVMTTIPAILNFFVCPWVSFKSDRHRGRWGRRMPFLLFPTPWLSLFLVLIGLAPDIGRFLGRTVFANAGMGNTTITLVLVGFFVVGFQYFNMFVASVYYYLFNDVVPDRFLGTTMALFRVVGSLAGAAFSAFIFPHAETHMRWIYFGAAALYLIVFSLMCVMVKEGDYPPPPENIDGRVSLLSSIKTYFVECFAHKFYWFFFFSSTAWTLSGIIGPWLLFMQQKSLGLELFRIGRINATAGLISAAILLPAGMISDKKHPVRTTLIAIIGLTCLTPLRLIYLFYSPTPDVAYHIEFGIALMVLPLSALYNASNLPLFMRLLPAERYGQYCAAEAMVRSLAIIVSGLVVGGFMDIMQRVCALHHAPQYFYYRYAPLWTWTFQIVALCMMIIVYRNWLKLGGDKGYVPPAVGRVAQQEREALVNAVDSVEDGKVEETV